MALDRELLEALLEGTANLLLERIEAGEATPADVSNALRMLKDNDISVIVKDSDALSELNSKLAKRRIGKPSLDDAKEATSKSEAFGI